MNKTEMSTLLGYRVGDRDDMAGRIDAELPFVQQYILEAKEWLPWFLLTENSLMVTGTGSRAVAVPDDFLLEAEEGNLYLTRNGEIIRRLVKMDFDTALAKYPGSGEPVAYSTFGDAIQLFPIPEENLGLYFTYYGKGGDITLDTPVSKWYLHAGDLVTAETGRILAEKHIKDAAAAASFAQDAQTAWNRLYHKHIAMQELNNSHVMNGD